MSSKVRPAVAVSQTLTELLEANEGYLNWLDSIGAEETKGEFITSLERIASRPEALYYPALIPYPTYIPQAFLRPTPLAPVGGITLSPYTHRSTNLESFADPLNLIFTGEAQVDRVASILMNELFPPRLWSSTVLPVIYDCAETHWVYVDNEGDRKWQSMDYTLAIGGCAFNRCHIRLFDGGFDERLGEFTLANVHYEESYLWKIHAIVDWDRSQNFVRQLFEASPFCKRIRKQQLQVKGEVVQNVQHDGIATVIELQ